MSHPRRTVETWSPPNRRASRRRVKLQLSPPQANGQNGVPGESSVQPTPSRAQPRPEPDNQSPRKAPSQRLLIPRLQPLALAAQGSPAKPILSPPTWRPGQQPKLPFLPGYCLSLLRAPHRDPNRNSKPNPQPRVRASAPSLPALPRLRGSNASNNHTHARARPRGEASRPTATYCTLDTKPFSRPVLLKRKHKDAGSPPKESNTPPPTTAAATLLRLSSSSSNSETPSRPQTNKSRCMPSLPHPPSANEKPEGPPKYPPLL